MSSALYRKYRASKFEEIHGQQVVIEVITQAVKQSSPSHAYLFAGPRGTGKTSMARLLAKAVNCSNFSKNGDVCNVCESCKSIEANEFLDLVEIDAASNRGIEEIRVIKDSVNYLPTQGQYKVYIIDEVHMLTREAFNALLKTLEEPPAHIIFVLATTEPHKVPITILSRVQRFDYQLANEADLTSKINRIAKQEGWKIDPDAARLIYEHSEGSYRDAESLLGKVFSSQGIGNKDVSVDMIRKLVGLPPQAQVEEMYEGLVTGNALKCLQVLESCRSQGYSLSQLLHHLVRHLRLQLYTLVEEGGDIRRETAVLGKLLQAQADLRQIDDAGVVLEMTVYSLISGDNTRIENEVTKVAKSNPVSRSSGLKEKLSGKRSSKVSVKEGRTKDGPWDRLLKAAKAKDFKLWTALKACSSKAEKSNLVIIAPYKAALSQLEESLENKDLVEIVDSVYGLKPKLRLELVKQLSASNENLVEGIL